MPVDRQRKARLAAAEEYYRRSEGAVPGAAWSDVPLHRCHLPGIPYSYYDDELVVIRERTVALIERQKKEIERRQQFAATEDWNQSQNESGWIGVNE